MLADMAEATRLQKETERVEKQRAQYRSTARTAIVCFLIFGGLALYFLLMWWDVYQSQIDIPWAMRTPRQEWAQWPCFPAAIFAVLAFAQIHVWKEANDSLEAHK